MSKNTTNLYRLTVKMALRDWRAGELRLLFLALLVSVAALTSVGFLTDRTRAAIEGDTRKMLGGDLVVSTDAPTAPDWLAEARRSGLRTASTLTLVSMAMPASAPDGAARLVSLKGVSSAYPLHGAVSLADGSEGRPVLRPGTVWVDAPLAASTGLSKGSVLQLAGRSFTVAGVIVTEPDRRPSMLNLAPRVMVPLQDMEALELIGPGSRAVWRLQLTGDPAALAAYKAYVLKAHGDKPGLRLETPETSRAEMAEMLDRAESFLSLVSLMAAILSAVAIAIAARRFVLRHVDTCAMLRCLGLRQGQALALLAGELALLGIAAGLLGAALGFASHLVLLDMMGDWTRDAFQDTSASVMPALQGIGMALVLLAGFAGPQLLQLRGASHVSLVRREGRKPGVPVLLAALGGIAMSLLLMAWQTGDVAMAIGFGIGLPLLAAVFAFVAWLCLHGLERVRRRAGSAPLRFALAALCRRPAASIAQAVALSIGLAALLLLTVVKNDLLAEWRHATPADAPNHFIGNIQPDQLDDVTASLAKLGPVSPHASIRGRLLLVNGNPPTGNKPAHASSLQKREWEISTASAVPQWNTLIAGAWPASKAKPQFSMDEEAAEADGIKLGDVLTFDIAGEQVAAPVTSLRKVDWRSRRESFSLLLNEDAVEHLPRTYNATVKVPQGGAKAMGELSGRHPNLLVFDIGYFVSALERVVAQLTAAIEFLFLYVLAAGLLVLYAALAASRDERMGQAALLRALGATRRTLAKAQWIEHLLAGALAGGLAAVGATAGHWALAKFVFKLQWNVSPLLWSYGLLAGIACALAGGWLALRPVLNNPPLQSLRQA